jgi:hypothetical protein
MRSRHLQELVGHEGACFRLRSTPCLEPAMESNLGNDYAPKAHAHDDDREPERWGIISAM